MNVRTEFNWRIVYILIPLLPFLVGGLIRTIIIMTSSDFDFSVYNVFRTLYFSWDAVALSFSISLISFVVKNNLSEQPIPLPNRDREEDLTNNSSKLFWWGFFNLLSFALLLSFHVLCVELHKIDMKNTHICFSIIIYLLCIFTMRDVFRIQKNYNLTAKFL